MLFNQLLSVGAVPSQWKVAIITPVYKKGDHTDVQNYRPISLTCVTSKIMERIIVQQLTQYLLKRNNYNTKDHAGDEELRHRRPSHLEQSTNHPANRNNSLSLP